MTNEKINITQAELAHVGEGALAYLREIGSDELTARFPGMPELESGLKLWALFAANGQPILLSDARDTALAGAFQNDLTPVSLH
ncbi:MULTISPECIES: DUF1150 family protein [Mesorhizobium]|uniref:DUF1150 family protein n=1 Tax=Mesorhizobium australicum TaxID=536018 RepID=A0A1X7NDC0_9HYPH|nr:MULTISPECIES: DUF1150 family protein [Mesorhizobium]MCR5857891.1 DUF1150 family protein [Mesorhizobium sp. J428]SMH35699.1 hypothetical protein SAMN02982922_1627 [Mesorhizobium australicum]